MLPNGTCGKRFSNWLPDLPDVTIDHRYTYEDQGFNLQNTDINAAIGLVQLDKVDSFHAARRANFMTLKAMFADVKGTKTVLTLSEADPSWFGYPVICDTYEIKSTLVKALELAGIQTRNYFSGNILLHGTYKELGDWKLYPNANEVLRRVFFIGVSPHITQQHLDYINQTIQPFKS